METEQKKKLNLFGICPIAHIVALVSGVLILLFLALRDNHALMVRLSRNAIQPMHHAMARFWSFTDASAGEHIIALFVIGLFAYIVFKLISIIRGRERWKSVYALIMSLISAALFVYALYSTLWGVFYYGDDFQTMSGMEAHDISTEQLELVTRYFAARLNEYGALVTRDENGNYTADREELLRRSPEVFSVTEKRCPVLEGPDIRAKGMRFSRIMSYLDFTGFFFPFTAEANVNTDFPVAGFPVTVAHELSHQRGVAKEQEANFVAVMACLDYGDVDYCYSACQMAYIHLGNALHKADYDLWLDVFGELSEPVVRDLVQSNEYWDQFETPVQTVSNTVYEGFLQSYDQKLGLRSYGACVDLLVNYYEHEAEEYFLNNT